MSSKEENDGFAEGDTIEEIELQKPKRYQVVLLNDDYTTMEFVVYVLQKYFHKDLAAAEKIMLEVHQKGAGICGIYPYDIALTKSLQVMEDAKKRSFPLRCEVEAVDDD